MQRKQILQGIDNFKRLIDNNGYYVDKTSLAKELIDTPNQITLITRPRRFGKTLNMSMLEYFFEHPKCRKYDLEEVNVSYLFSGLEIFKHGEKYIKEQGKYPVIYLTLKNAKQDNWESTLYNLKKVISSEYKRHRYLLDGDVLSEAEKRIYEKVIVLEANIEEYTDAIMNLTEYLKAYFGTDCMVIIDEYDTPIQSGYINGYFKEVTEFMKSMLVKGFKDNKALKQGVLTGIMKIAQESIFSDFNNPLVCTVLSERYNDKFGFTEDEVEKMAEYLGLTSNLEDIKRWYNGYIFGLDTVIYNPWSIIKYMSSPQEGLKPYWINTSDNRIIKEV
ncbi:MAG TPA: AAA family ATPase, partial [Clostridiales bacterium]|nr:AAA family ATPase [Clostridiales bacterium]